MTNKEIEATFVQLREMYKLIKDEEAKNWGLVLGNHNEIYLMRGDGKKSVLLGKFSSSSDATEESELRKALVSLKEFFEKHGKGISANTKQSQVDLTKTPTKRVVLESDEKTPYIPEEAVTINSSELAEYAESDDIDLWAANL